MNNRVNSTLKSDSGASIIFVLCTMLFVMTVGVSVLVASSAAAGAATDSQALAKAELYSDSLIKTFTKALEDSIGKEIVIKTANDGLIKTDSKLTGFSPPTWESKDISIEKRPEKTSYTVTAEISASDNYSSLVTNHSFIAEIPEIPAIEEIKDDKGNQLFTKVDREPSVLTMSLSVIVRMDVEYGGKAVSVNSTYVCDGIEIYDNAVVDTDDDFGEWRLVKIEKVE
ncbi:MAG: hypothetical protein WBH44_11050 [Proteocatella sp.]